MDAFTLQDDLYDALLAFAEQRDVTLRNALIIALTDAQTILRESEQGSTFFAEQADKLLAVPFLSIKSTELPYNEQ